MRIVLNGEPQDVMDSISIYELLDQFSLGKERIAVERNGEIVRKVDYATTKLSVNDLIEVVRFVGGG